MKTKNLLVIILLIGLSFNAFSQEEVTIKQVIKNSSTNAASYGDAIKVIKIWTKIPVAIKSGKENAIYLTGDMKANEKDKLSSFCVLKNNVFEISSPYLFLDEESKPKDFSKFKITLELADDVCTYYVRSSSNLTISKDIITDKNGTFNLWSNSQIILEGEAKFEVLNIFAQENSKIRFNSINANGAILNMEKGSIIDLNGKVRDIEIMNQGEGAKLIGEHKGSSMMRHNVDVEDDDFMKRFKTDKVGNLISSKGDTIAKDSSSLVLKDLSNAFEEVAEDLKEEEPNEVLKPISDAFQSAADNLKNKDGKVEHKEKKKESKTDFGLQVGYGILSWSKKGWFNDNIFSHSEGVYALKNGSSWSLGFRYTYKVNSDFEISTGLGYESNIFRFETNVMLNDINGEKRIGFENDPSINAESKLVARYVTIPLFYKVRMRKNFYLHGGLVVGVNFRTSSTGFKRNYDIPNAEVEERWGTKYDNFKPVKLDVQAGFGWGFTNFYVKYAVTPLFKDNKEIEVYPYSVGISFGL